MTVLTGKNQGKKKYIKKSETVLLLLLLCSSWVCENSGKCHLQRNQYLRSVVSN